MSRQEVVEDVQEHMRVDTGLVMVGSADDQMRAGKMKKLMEGVTQSMIDWCILVSTKRKWWQFPYEMEIFPFLFHSCLSRIILLKVSLLFY
jgi:hypothetical protein